MKSRRSTYLAKLIVYAICLITIPMATLGVFSYIHSSRTVQQKVNDGALQMLLQLQQRVEQSLRTADNTLTQFTLQPSVLRLLTANAADNMGAPGRAAAVEALQEGLRRLQLADLNVADVQFVQLSDRWKITGSGYEPFGSNEPDWRQAYNGRPGSHWTIGSRTIDYVKTLPIGSSEPTALILFKVPYGELRKYMFTHPELGEPFIVDDSLRVVAHTDRLTRTGSSAASMPYARQLLGSGLDRGLFKTELDGEPFNVIFSKSAYNGWTYVSLVSVTDMTRASEAIKWVTAAASAVILLVGTVVSLLGARRLYGPIRKLYESVFQTVEEDEDGGGAPDGGKDELQLIDERIQARWQSQRRMSRELKSQRSRLQHFFMLKLYLGQTEPGEREAYELEAGQQWKAMSVLLLQIDSLEGTGYEERDKELLLFAVTNMVAELVPPQERLLQPIVMGASQVTLVGSPLADEAAYSAWLDGTAKRIRETVKQVLRLPVSVGVSGPFHALGEAGRGYKEAGEALQYRIRLGHEAVVHIGDVRPDRSLVPQYPESVKRELIEAVRMCEGERAYGLLAQFTQEVFAAPLSHRQYQVLMLALLTELLRMLQEHEGVLQSLYAEEKQLYDRLFELKTSAEMIDWLHHSVIMPAIRLLEERKTKQYQGITSELLHMIENEYETPLTVEGCAFRIHYHPDYVRHVFRKEIGMPFSDYLARHRLQVAKGWLTGTDMRIAEMAERLQYTNAQNFIRYFRKMEGMTPGQYRDRRGAGTQESL